MIEECLKVLSIYIYMWVPFMPLGVSRVIPWPRELPLSWNYTRTAASIKKNLLVLDSLFTEKDHKQIITLQNNMSLVSIKRREY